MHNGSGGYVQMYAHMASGANQFSIEVNGGTAIASSSALANQSPSCFCAVGSTGPYTAYHLFAKTSASPYLHALIEIQSNMYADLFFGTLNVVGGASPGVYIATSAWNYTFSGSSFWDQGAGFGPVSNQLPFHNASNSTQVGATVDGLFQWYNGKGQLSTPQVRAIMALGSTGSALGSQFDSIMQTPNTFNELSPLFPLPVLVQRLNVNVYSYIGDAPDLRVVNMANFTPKDEMTIGPDTWKIFPFIQKSLPLNTSGAPASSGPYGVALLKSA